VVHSNATLKLGSDLLNLSFIISNGILSIECFFEIGIGVAAARGGDVCGATIVAIDEDNFAEVLELEQSVGKVKGFDVNEPAGFNGESLEVRGDGGEVGETLEEAGQGRDSGSGSIYGVGISASHVLGGEVDDVFGVVDVGAEHGNRSWLDVGDVRDLVGLLGG